MLENWFLSIIFLENEAKYEKSKDTKKIVNVIMYLQ